MFFCKASRRYSKFSLLILFGWSFLIHLYADDVGAIIDQEKLSYQQWLSREESLPPAILWPQNKNILLYDTSMDNNPAVNLCSNVAFDQLVSESYQSSGDNLIPINFISAEARQNWADGCLIRPEDVLMAIGPGYQKKVVLQSVGAQNIWKPGRLQASIVIEGTFTEEVPEPPLFFSSDPSLSEGDNNFFELKNSTITLAKNRWREKLAGHIRFLDEYDGKIFISTAPNCDAIIALHKREILDDDIGLPHEQIWSLKGDSLTKLIEEKIDPAFPTGHVAPLGWFDFNHDGFVDLVVEGDHRGCVYHQLFMGSEDGLSSENVSRPICLAP